ncbi:MAG TPA: hypothetical protein VFP50_20910, partial [Anaeromyxobacteraceae bacterium]|nr:hypothetical protein [Anaeromyxobacteraceae bacterium]
RFRDLVLGLVREDLAAGPAGAVPREAVVAFVGGALLELLTWALEAKRTPDAAELDALFHRLVGPVLVEAGILAGGTP